ncbi:MAG TPA: protein-methionine-sulfoxide reductase heme-binding subunit MsrQ [Burkholderiales bacterium]|jgi:sulfoxide reductase heme-binding subunit YedZ|nr:protein-methionine-sulfoxide reductase heme-binding subunit MsrQ [Burkholderiales bacterium]
MQPTHRQIAWIKAALFAACLVPLARLAWLATHRGLGANPIEYVTHSTGWWTLALLLLTLSVTPLRRIAGAAWLLRLRRMLGLFAFFYASLHFTTYIWLDQFFDLAGIVKDVAKRPFITVGFAAFVLLLPLAATSTNAMVRRLGARRWQALHRLVYVIATLGVLHFWWLVKKDVTEPLWFAALLAALLAWRLAHAWRQRRAAAPARAPDSRPA